VRRVTRLEDPTRAAARETLGLRVKLLRVGAKMSQRTLAEALNVRPATVSAWELGTSELAALDAVRIAAVFKVEVGALLSLDLLK